MTIIEITLTQLRGMIGTRVVHQGEACEVVEVLEDGPSLVLLPQHRQSTIQPNQYGEATRRARPSYTVPVLGPQRDALSAEFLALELLD
jgi:hypothetical protein